MIFQLPRDTYEISKDGVQADISRYPNAALTEWRHEFLTLRVGYAYFAEVVVEGALVAISQDVIAK